jgi:hypothetical protein
MNRKKILTAIILFSLPIIVRVFWFYQGIYQPVESIQTPEYMNYTIPTPNLSTLVPDPILPVNLSPGKHILIDQTHQNNFKPSEIEPFLVEMSKQNSSIAYTSYQELFKNQLDRADAFVIIAPTFNYTLEEMEAIQSFVQRGGRLLIFAEPTRKFATTEYFESIPSATNSVDILNSLLGTYGIMVEDGYVYNQVENEGNFRNVIFREIIDDEITEGVKEIVFFSTHNIRTQQNGLIKGNSDMHTSGIIQGQDINVAARSRDGNILVLGDFTFLTHPYYQVADNPILIRNLAQFLSTGTTVHSLEDYPQIFSESLNIVIPEDIIIDKDWLEVFSSLQSSAQNRNQSIKLSRDILEGEDQLILSTYDKGELVNGIFNKFGIQVDEGKINNESGMISIPDIGDFSISEIGLFLFSAGKKENQLYLIAESFNKLKILIDYYQSNSLSSCFVEKNLAVCPLDNGYISQDDFPEYQETSENNQQIETPISEMEFTPSPYLPIPTQEPQVTPF